MWADAIQLIFELNKPVYLNVANAVEVAGFAIIIALVIGVPLGIVIGFHRFQARKLVLFFLHLWMFVPAVGLGIFLAFLHNQTVIAPPGYIFWGALLIFPYFTSLLADIFYDIPRDAKLDVVALGASYWQRYYAFFKEKRTLVWGALSVGIARIFTEIGGFFLILGFLYNTSFPSEPAIALHGSAEIMAVAIMLFCISGVVYLGIHFFQFARESRRA